MVCDGLRNGHGQKERLWLAISVANGLDVGLGEGVALLDEVAAC